MTTFLCFVGALILGGPIVVTALAYLGRRRIEASVQRARANVPTRASLPAFARECGATLAVLAAGLFPWLWTTGDTPRSPLALLLPDAGLSSGTFFLLRRRLRGMGWSVALGATHPRPDRLCEAIERLDARIRSLRPRHSHIVLIGHGTGGLLARSLAAARDGAGVRQLITLGTPHQGTEARISRLPGFRSLMPGSSLLRAIAQDPPDENGPERVAIYSEFDAWVVPVEAAYDQGAFNIQVRGIGHFSLLTSRRVYALLAENLTPDPGQADARPSLTPASTRATSLESL